MNISSCFLLRIKLHRHESKHQEQDGFVDEHEKKYIAVEMARNKM